MIFQTLSHCKLRNKTIYIKKIILHIQALLTLKYPGSRNRNIANGDSTYVRLRHTPKAAVRASIQPAVAWLLDQNSDELSPVKREKVRVGCGVRHQGSHGPPYT